MASLSGTNSSSKTHRQDDDHHSAATKLSFNGWPGILNAAKLQAVLIEQHTEASSILQGLKEEAPKVRLGIAHCGFIMATVADEDIISQEK